MEAELFDSLTRHWGQRRTRRTVTALLAGLLGGPLSASLVPAPAEAACRGLNQACTKQRPGIGKRRKCCSGLVCRSGRCRVKECSVALGCGEGRRCCGGKCLDVRSDPRNCGQCGKDCGDSPCLGGRCVSPCVDGWTSCGGECVDVLRDPAHCGTCRTPCGDGAPICRDGRCVCRQRLEVCDLNGECCQNAQRAPLADPRDWQSPVRCWFWDVPAKPGVEACEEPPESAVCCVGRGSVCGSDCDCCDGLRCLGDYGCGFCVGPGRACPSQCPSDGPCDLCCDDWCDKGFCRTTCQTLYEVCNLNDPGNPGPCCLGLTCIRGVCELENNCQNHGQSCSSLLPCCPDLRCRNGICEQPCVIYGGGCQTAGDCCNDVPCSGGLCRYN